MDAIIPLLPEQFLVLLKEENFNAFMLSFWASMGTFVGGVLVVVIVGLLGADPTSSKTTHLMGVLQSLSGGVMIFMTCFHLIPESIEEIGSQETMVFFFLGVVAFGVLEGFIIPHDHDEDEHDHSHDKKKDSHNNKQKQSKTEIEEKLAKKEAKELFRTSLITFIAMALHNIPEGISVYLAALSNPKMGAQLALAILLHNVPEGMAVAIPLFASTGSYVKVLWWTLINGLAEPAGVITVGLFLGPYLTPFILNRCLAMVSGIMFCISLHELYPVSLKYCGKTAASVSLFGGMFICWLALEAVDVYFGDIHGHSHSHGSSHVHDHGHDHGHSHHHHHDHDHHHHHHH
ncbi:ZIP zinc transporter-domain-containing protein [Globomyces pollinis-pini]|nr:ZIP zinc transporter-domain-containing protein [Globomyces pollinis-pini]